MYEENYKDNTDRGMDEKVKTPEINDRLVTLQESIASLREKLSPVIVPEGNPEKEKEERSQSYVMETIHNIIEEVDDITRSIDIN